MTNWSPDSFSADTLWSRLSEVADRKPFDDAVVLADQRVSFAELRNQTALRAAALTQANSEQPEHFIPLFVDFSLESIVDLLACLCFRIPFSPLDPDLPEARIDALWALLDSPKIYSLPPRIELRAEPPNAKPTFGSAQGSSQCEPRQVSGHGDGLAIMTSGSTGSPKGVVLSFAVIDYRVDSAISSLDPQNEPEIVTSFSPFHFIGGLRQLFQLFAGRTILRLQPSTWTPRSLLDRITEEGATHLLLPAQLARILSSLAAQSAATMPRVTQISIGAEAIRYEWVKGFESIVNQHATVRHTLGSTEATGSFVHRFSLKEAPSRGTVPIGLPASAHVQLVEWNTELPGVYEVWRSGAIVSRYLGDSLHNITRLVTDENGITWWKSGDLVKLGSDNLYYHHSRVDDVVKIRGKLASPSETALALMTLGIGHRAVVLPDRSGEDTILVAHIEKGAVENLSARDVRQRLAKLLPEHLMPSKIVFHDKLPLNSRGKVDHSALYRAPIAPNEKA